MRHESALHREPCERKRTRKEETGPDGGRRRGNGEMEMVQRFIINERRKEDAAREEETKEKL
jgi:hypothetical protein